MFLGGTDFPGRHLSNLLSHSSPAVLLHIYVLSSKDHSIRIPFKSQYKVLKFRSPSAFIPPISGFFGKKHHKPPMLHASATTTREPLRPSIARSPAAGIREGTVLDFLAQACRRGSRDRAWRRIHRWREAKRRCPALTAVLFFGGCVEREVVFSC